MADSTYDVAFAIETVYFWPDLCAGLREMRRGLRSRPQARVIHVSLTAYIDYSIS